MRTGLRLPAFAAVSALAACGAPASPPDPADPTRTGAERARASFAPDTGAGDTSVLPTDPPPNLLLIIADDLGVDKVRAYATDEPGYLRVAEQLPVTPTIDGLATAGLRFSTAWSSPLCSPTRATLQTGRYAFRTNVGQPFPEGPPLSPAETTLAQRLLAGNGAVTWSTGYFGKWHLGEEGVDGTEDWALAGGGVTERLIKDAPNPVVFGWSTFDGMLLGVLEDYHSWTRVMSSGPGSARVVEETTYATASTTESASAWIAAQTGPWFATVAYNAPHLSAANAGAYGDSDLDPDCAPLPAFSGGDHERAVYRALVECMDNRIGALLRAVPQDQLANTLIVFMGDNGTPSRVLEGMYASRGERTTNGKSTVYESGVHVPLIVTDGANWMEWQACSDLQRRNGACRFSDHRVVGPGRAVEAPVQLTDLYATLAELTDVDASTAVDSVSFAACLTNDDPGCSGDARAHPRRLYTEGFSCSDEASPCDPDHLLSGFAAMRRGPYKLVTSYDRTLGCLTDELFALRRDPHEQNDIADEQPEVAERLHAEIVGLGAPWMAGVGICGG